MSGYPRGHLSLQDITVISYVVFTREEREDKILLLFDVWKLNTMFARTHCIPKFESVDSSVTFEN